MLGQFVTNRAVIKRQGLGISTSYYERGPQVLSKENRRKRNKNQKKKNRTKRTPSCLILCLLAVFTQQLESLVTAPLTVSKPGHMYQKGQWQPIECNLKSQH